MLPYVPLRMSLTDILVPSLQSAGAPTPLPTRKPDLIAALAKHSAAAAAASEGAASAGGSETTLSNSSTRSGAVGAAAAGGVAEVAEVVVPGIAGLNAASIDWQHPLAMTPRGAARSAADTSEGEPATDAKASATGRSSQEDTGTAVDTGAAGRSSKTPQKRRKAAAVEETPDSKRPRAGQRQARVAASRSQGARAADTDAPTASDAIVAERAVPPAAGSDARTLVPGPLKAELDADAVSRMTVRIACMHCARACFEERWSPN
jgi:hypothetical protein